MRFLFLSMLLTLPLASTSVSAGGNLPMCLAIQQNYNQCVEQQRRRQHHYGWYEEEENEWEPPHYRSYHHQHQQQNCNAWIIVMKANNCF